MSRNPLDPNRNDDLLKQAVVTFSFGLFIFVLLLLAVVVPFADLAWWQKILSEIGIVVGIHALIVLRRLLLHLKVNPELDKDLLTVAVQIACQLYVK